MEKETMEKILPFLGVTATLLLATVVFIGGGAVPTVVIFGTLMLLLVEFQHRQTPKDRKFIRTVTGIAMILCAIWAGFTIINYPANALTVTGEEVGGNQIEWNISGGMPPYTVWINDKNLYENYPSAAVITDAEPGKTYSMTVQDAHNETATAQTKAPFYTFPLEIWLLFALFVVFMLGSYFVPFAAFGAAIIGGFLMIMIGPNPDYAGYLRIIACAAFIGGLGAIFIGGESS